MYEKGLEKEGLLVAQKRYHKDLCQIDDAIEKLYKKRLLVCMKLHDIRLQLEGDANEEVESD